MFCMYDSKSPHNSVKESLRFWYNICVQIKQQVSAQKAFSSDL